MSWKVPSLMSSYSFYWGFVQAGASDGIFEMGC